MNADKRELPIVILEDLLSQGTANERELRIRLFDGGDHRMEPVNAG
jgi:hypothetical protein